LLLLVIHNAFGFWLLISKHIGLAGMRVLCELWAAALAPEDTFNRKSSNLFGFSLAYWINISRSTKEIHSFCPHLIDIFVSLHPKRIKTYETNTAADDLADGAVAMWGRR
jgi:hypothetical protein